MCVTNITKLKLENLYLWFIAGLFLSCFIRSR